MGVELWNESYSMIYLQFFLINRSWKAAIFCPAICKKSGMRDRTPPPSLFIVGKMQWEIMDVKQIIRHWSIPTSKKYILIIIFFYNFSFALQGLSQKQTKPKFNFTEKCKIIVSLKDSKCKEIYFFLIIIIEIYALLH